MSDNLAVSFHENQLVVAIVGSSSTSDCLSLDTNTVLASVKS